MRLEHKPNAVEARRTDDGEDAVGKVPCPLLLLLTTSSLFIRTLRSARFRSLSLFEYIPCCFRRAARCSFHLAFSLGDLNLEAPRSI